MRRRKEGEVVERLERRTRVRDGATRLFFFMERGALLFCRACTRRIRFMLCEQLRKSCAFVREGGRRIFRVVGLRCSWWWGAPRTLFRAARPRCSTYALDGGDVGWLLCEGLGAATDGFGSRRRGSGGRCCGSPLSVPPLLNKTLSAVVSVLCVE